MGSPSQIEEQSKFELGEDLDQTSHLTDAHLKPLLAALEKAKSDEAQASPDHVITQKIAPEVIEALREQAKRSPPLPLVEPVNADGLDQTLTMNTGAFIKAMETLPKAMRDQVAGAFGKAKASVSSEVPKAFAADAIERELARAITSGHLSSLLERMNDPAFAATIAAAYEKELTALP